MYQAILANKVKTAILIGLFVLIFIGAIFVYFEAYGVDQYYLSYAGIGIILVAIINYYVSDKITLGLSGAKEVSRQNYPELYNVVDTLAITTGIPTPKVYVIESDALNAFATGRDPNHATVAITHGLLKRLEKVELEGVIAHEMSHIKNYDMRLMTMVAIFAGMFTIMSDWFLRFTFWGGGRSRSDRNNAQGIFMIIGLVLALLSPLIAMLIKLAISRKREYLADSTAALMTRYPEGLARALEKIGADTVPLKSASRAMAHLYIANPLKSGWLNGLFSTHPPIEERVRQLRSMIG
jgi:heat shock protein HtpX